MHIYFVTWLNLQADKMKRILCFDWLPKQGTSCKKTFIFGDIINPLLTKLVQSRWQDIVLNGFVFVHGLVKLC